MTNGTSNKKLRPSPGYSKSRQAERTLYLSGDIGLDYATGVLPEGGIEARSTSSWETSARPRNPRASHSTIS